MRDALDEAVPRLWRYLPVLLLATLPWAVAAVVASTVYLAGALLLAPFVAAVALGPAWQLLADACSGVVRDEPVRLRALVRPALRRGVLRALPVTGAALLVAANLRALQVSQSPAVLRASLVVNLVVFGCALLVAPFAFAAPAGRTVAAWRYGAGVAAASPAYVLLLLGFLAVAAFLVWALGPVPAYLTAPVVATCTAAVTRTALARARA